MPSDEGEVESDVEGEGERGKARHTGLIVILAIVVLVVGMSLTVAATNPLYLTRPLDGAPPVFRTETGGGQGVSEDRYLTWDVRKRAETSFRPDGIGRGFGFDGRELRGELTLSVPGNCTDRRVRWEIHADGDRLGGGSTRGRHRYAAKTDFSVDGTPDAVTITLSWDGGDTACPSFGAEWKNARVERSPIG
ncbi:hypothetical protein ACFWZ2_25885 [Streptomyces sp. NPDC059002]|uniref:hypothetical protein n=1 Tax=Streptomyces sp. NPDC059002 TaxID=3346690 RepID=UPI0036A63784